MSSIHTHSERSAHTGIAIVWPAWFAGSTDPELHATALFLGNTDTVDFTKEDVEACLHHYLWPGWTKVTGMDWFGHNKDIPVLTLDRTNLLVITRLNIKENLERRGIHASTAFPFTPHVTVAKQPGLGHSTPFPLDIHLESPVLWWGSSRPIHTNHAQEADAA